MNPRDQDPAKILPKEFSILRSFGLAVYGDWADYQWVSTYKGKNIESLRLSEVPEPEEYIQNILYEEYYENEAHTLKIRNIGFSLISCW